jgi:hypothetical protein
VLTPIHGLHLAELLQQHQDLSQELIPLLLQMLTDVLQHKVLQLPSRQLFYPQLQHQLVLVVLEELTDWLL